MKTSIITFSVLSIGLLILGFMNLNYNQLVEDTKINLEKNIFSGSDNSKRYKFIADSLLNETMKLVRVNDYFILSTVEIYDESFSNSKKISNCFLGKIFYPDLYINLKGKELRMIAEEIYVKQLKQKEKDLREEYGLLK